MKRPGTWIYDARLLRGVAIVVFVSTLLSTFVAAQSDPVEQAGLAVLEGGVQRSEDAPFTPAAFEFLPGDYLHFTFHIAGFKVKANQTGEIKSLSLQYKITPEDRNGIALAPSVEGKIEADLQNEDKNWTPKRRASFLLPSFVASGTYQVHAEVKDLIANTEATRNYPFRIGGVQIPDATGIRADSFEFLRGSEEGKPLDIPAYSAGDVVYARFLMLGFKLETGNKYRVSYGLKIVRPDGKTFLDQPKAAQIADSTFYPAQFVPGELQVTTPRDAMHGQYRLTVTVRDLVANQSYDLKQVFSIE